jgi:hypothetical protein
MIHASARADRCPNAVAPWSTRSIAPPIQPVMMCDCGVGTSANAAIIASMSPSSTASR